MGVHRIEREDQIQGCHLLGNLLDTGIGVAQRRDRTRHRCGPAFAGLEAVKFDAGQVEQRLQGTQENIPGRIKTAGGAD